MKPALHIQGMHGLGDCLHQRAIIRQLMETRDVTLETSWPSVYHDLIAQGLKVTRRPVGLRTQSKNANRESEAAQYSAQHQFAPRGMRIAYGGGQVLQTASKTILEVMCNATGCRYDQADYRLPIPDDWKSRLAELMGPLPLLASERPWMLFRPLVARHEWRGGLARNADAVSYGVLLDAIRERFFVVSVADLADRQEWLIGPDTKADLCFHHGELVFEALAALAARSALVLSSSGFAAILGPAVETPTISVIGGYESVGCHDSGKKFAPYLAIGPDNGCSCWTSHCKRSCDKTLNMEAARAAILSFVEENIPCPRT